MPGQTGEGLFINYKETQIFWGGTPRKRWDTGIMRNSESIHGFSPQNGWPILTISECWLVFSHDTTQVLWPPPDPEWHPSDPWGSKLEMHIPGLRKPLLEWWTSGLSTIFRSPTQYCMIQLNIQNQFLLAGTLKNDVFYMKNSIITC